MTNDNMVTLVLTRGERVRLWDSLDRILAGQPIEKDALASLGWIRDRIARQCYAEVEDVDLTGDRTEAFRRMTAHKAHLDGLVK